MRAICLVDTSVFVTILRVPNMSPRHREIIEDLKQRYAQGHLMFLPFATILESGNHIGQQGDGNQRRETASRFVQQVEKALDGTSPFTPLSFPGETAVREWLRSFPDWVGIRSGLGDLSIKRDWNELCNRHQRWRVYVWSLDKHLACYDRMP